MIFIGNNIVSKYNIDLSFILVIYWQPLLNRFPEMALKVSMSALYSHFILNELEGKIEASFMPQIVGEQIHSYSPERI